MTAQFKLRGHEAEIVEMVNRRLPMTAIAKKFGCSRRAVANILKSIGVKSKARGGGVSKFDRNCEIVNKMLDDGHSRLYIAKALNVSPATLTRWSKAIGRQGIQRYEVEEEWLFGLVISGLTDDEIASCMLESAVAVRSVRRRLGFINPRHPKCSPLSTPTKNPA